MKTRILKITAISLMLVLTGGFSACDNSKPEDVLIGHFFVSVGFNDGQPSECGYLLFRDTGCRGHFHNGFKWAENLPKEFQIDGLRVIVTYRIVKEGNPIVEDGFITGCYFPIIDIINIRKNEKNIVVAN